MQRVRLYHEREGETAQRILPDSKMEHSRCRAADGEMIRARDHLRHGPASWAIQISRCHKCPKLVAAYSVLPIAANPTTLSTRPKRIQFPEG